jgi:ATP-dependent helicase/nuclease subunit A
VNAAAIAELFRSSLGQRIRSADRVWREFRFSLLCDAGELLHAGSGEEILLQGVVDCCIEESGELVIIDYKTDNVHTEEQLQQRCSLYESQVRAYAMALSRIFSMPVKESVLYFLSCGRTFTIENI